jgi:YHS domain-containing protein
VIFVTRRTSIGLVAGGLCLALAGAAFAIEQKVFSAGGFAINGYDPVAYFKQGKPVPGNPAIAAEWNGAKWLFSSEENKAAFLADPLSLSPQYGGYCAYAVAKNQTAKTDPQAFTVHNGKLYLNYSPAIAAQWRKDLEQNIVAGDKNWPGIVAK